MNAFNFDFSKDKPNIRDVIPAGTKLLLRMSYTPGGIGGPEMQNALSQSKDTDAKYLKAEFTVLRGPYKGRKFWENMTFTGGKLDEKGNSIGGSISRGTVRSIIDASEGLSSKDESPAACAKRVLPSGFPGLQGRVFPVKVGVEAAKGNYPAKNKLGTILTIDHKDYPKSEAELDTMGPANTQAPTALPDAAAPAWTGAAPSVAALTAPTVPPLAPPVAEALAPLPAQPAPMPAPQALAPAPAPVAAVAPTSDASPVPAWMRQ